MIISVLTLAESYESLAVYCATVYLPRLLELLMHLFIHQNVNFLKIIIFDLYNNISVRLGTLHKVEKKQNSSSMILANQQPVYHCSNLGLELIINVCV